MNNTSSLLVLEPPYAMVRWLREDSPAMGSILLMDILSRTPAPAEMRSVTDVAPWCPVCVLADRRIGGRGTRRIPRTCVVVGVESAPDATAAILRAVDDRPRPTPSTLVEWIVKRTRCHSVGRTLSELFTRPLLRKTEAAYLPYTLREQLALLGSWTALEWQHAAQFAEYAADRTSLKRLLSADDPSSRDTRHRMHDLLGVTEREFHEAHGWEWVLELALRRSGFFELGARNYRRMPTRRMPVPGVAAALSAYASREYGERAIA
jgi:hypothetical protein